MNRGGKSFVGKFLADPRGQAMTEYVILTLLVTCACVFLLDPQNEIYVGLRRMYDFIGNGLCLPGP